MLISQLAFRIFRCSSSWSVRFAWLFLFFVSIFARTFRIAPFCHIGPYFSHCFLFLFCAHLGAYVSHCCVFGIWERTFRIAVFLVFAIILERAFRIAVFLCLRCHLRAYVSHCCVFVCQRRRRAQPAKFAGPLAHRRVRSLNLFLGFFISLVLSLFLYFFVSLIDHDLRGAPLEPWIPKCVDSTPTRPPVDPQSTPN